MHDSTSPLKLVNLTKRYKTARGVENLNIEVRPGEVFGFLGPNGAGKTTTIRTIMNFMKPTSGSISLYGLDSVKDSVRIKQKVGYLAGDFELYDSLTAQQYLDFVAHLHKVTDPTHLRALTKRLNVTMHQKIHTLSRGNKQKIGLVAALLHDPELLVLDEPTSGLDPLMQNQFYEIIAERKRQGKSVFISSHILSEVQEICDRVAFMRDGKLVEIIDVAALLHEARKKISIMIKPGTKLTQLPKFTNLEIQQKTASQLVFSTTQSVKDVLKWLSIQPLDDVVIENTNLDEAFLKLYGDVKGGQHV